MTATWNDEAAVRVRAAAGVDRGQRDSPVHAITRAALVIEARGWPAWHPRVLRWMEELCRYRNRNA